MDIIRLGAHMVLGGVSMARLKGLSPARPLKAAFDLVPLAGSTWHLLITLDTSLLAS